MSNLTPFPTPMDRLAEAIRMAYQRTEHGRAEWIEGTLELAARLLESRKRFASTKEFSHWIVDNDLEDLSHQKRAALINMAAHPELTREVLQETHRSSWEYIWSEEIQPRLTYVRKPDAESEVNEPSPEKSAPKPENATPDEAEPHNKIVGGGSVPDASTRSAFRGLTRSGELEAVYLNTNTRTVIGRAVKHRGGKEILQLILQALDAGFIKPNKTEIRKLTAKALFTDARKLTYLSRLDLTIAADRKTVRDQILPAAIANRERVLQDISQLQDIVKDHWQQKSREEAAAASKRNLDAAVQALPVTEQSITVYGIVLWPRVGEQHGSYNYYQLCAAIWTFNNFKSWMCSSGTDASPESIAIMMRHSTRWFTEYLRKDRTEPDDGRVKMARLLSCIHLIASLYENNPNGECIEPPTPKIEGDWW